MIKQTNPKGLSILAIAVAHNRLGYVFLYDGEVMDWGVSEGAARSPEKAQVYTHKILGIYSSDLVITEDSYTKASRKRKGAHTQALVESVEAVAAKHDCQHITRPRTQPYGNKYTLAVELARKYPVLAPYVPKQPPIWMPEARNIMIFEALALAEQIGSHSP